jgi:protoporphyrinogen oxidase
MNSSSYPEITIIGAGLSGLSLAYHYPGKSKIFEKMIRIGGTAGTDREGEFFYDHGPHVSFTKDPYVTQLLSRNVEVVERVARPMNVFQKREFPHPALFHLNRFSKQERFNILKDLVESYRKLDPKNQPKNYEEWLMKSQGEYFAVNYTNRYTRKFWQTESKYMTTDWVSARIPNPSITEALSGSLGMGNKSGYYFERFRYPKYGGFGSFSNFWKSRKEDIEVNLQMEVVEIDTKNKVLRFSDKSSIDYRHLVSTIPLPELTTIVSGLPREIKNLIEKLRYTSLHYVNLALKGGWKRRFSWLYIYDEDIPVSRMIPFNSINPTASPSGTTSLQLEIPFTHRFNLALVDQSISKMQEIGYINSDRILKITNTDLKYGYVIYDKSREEVLSKIRTYLEAEGILLLGRYGTWKYLWSHQAILQGREMASKITRTVSKNKH